MDMSGKIVTVLGAVKPEEVGITLAHEHMSTEFQVMEQPPPAGIPDAANIVNLPLVMARLGYARQYPYSFKENLSMNKEAVETDMKLFKAAGGDCLVENSVIGLSRDISFVVKVAQETTVKIVAGTGYYVDASQSPSVRQMTSESLAEIITRDLTDGIDGSHHKAGVIGEIGCTWPLTDFEKASLRASAAVQQALGCPVIIHPGRDRKAVFEIMRIFTEASGDASRTVMSHLDRSLPTDAEILEFAKVGCICEYDLFGTEVSHYQFAPDTDMPSDAERIRRIKLLIKEGYEDCITIAHDIHTNHRLSSFGGHGYTHILENVVPMMKVRGISQENIDKMLIHTPRRWLTFK